MKFILPGPLAVLTLTLPLFAQFHVGSGQVQELYQNHCAVCHGQSLEGGLGGPLIGRQREVPEGYRDLADYLARGNEDAGMPGFADTLSAPQIRSLVIFLQEMESRAAQKKQTTPRPAPDGQPHSSEKHAFTVQPVATGLQVPWGLAFLPDDRLLVTQRGGELVVIEDGQVTPITGTPEVWAHGQGGLMEVALHPDFESNGWIYLGYSASSTPPDAGRPSGSTRIVRGRIRDHQWVDEELVFEVPERFHSASRVHFGTRFVFQGGYLFFTIGDRGQQRDAQNLASPHGKTHRIHDDGRIPTDNPFVDRENAFPTIWTYGNRNAQGLALHPTTGQLWESEHGPRGGDEINLLKRGANYGWPLVTHGMNYNGTPITEHTELPGMEPPAWHWTPSIAVCGIAFYEGQAFPGWQNQLFVGGLASQQLHRLVIEGEKVVHDEIILRGMGRVRDVVTGPDGFLYLVLNQPDRIVRLEPAP